MAWPGARRVWTTVAYALLAALIVGGAVSVWWGARYAWAVHSLTRGVGDTVQIRPDTDVWFLASLLHEIDRLDGFDRHVLANHGAHVDELRAFIAQYPADRTAAITGITDS